MSEHSGFAEKVLHSSILHESPFFILDVTTRDNTASIIDAAEERSLEYDFELCQKARSILTKPRARLSEEVKWLPGLSPSKVNQLLEQVLKNPFSIIEEEGLPFLAHLNLLAASSEAIDDFSSKENVTTLIMEMAGYVDLLNAEDIWRDINEDRSISGFPAINHHDHVISELDEQKRYYRDAVIKVLNNLPTVVLIEVMTDIVDSSTENGNNHAPELVEQLVESYELETHDFLGKEAKTIQDILTNIQANASLGEDSIKPLIDKLIDVTRNWDMVAQPIQLVAKSQGLDHDASVEVAHSIRNLGIELFNEHDLLHQAKRTTELLQELFSELPELIDRVDADSDALEDIFHNRKQSESRRKEWADEIAFSTEVGILFKDRLAISLEGISWKNNTFALDSITRVRWGGVQHSVNGVSTGTTYTIGFGDNRKEAVVELKDEYTYSVFIDKLWKSVCVRLLTEILETLGNGEAVWFGNVAIYDDRVTLTKHKLFGSNEKINFKWNQVSVWSADGEFVIGAKGDTKTYSSMSYINTNNTHILEQAIRMLFKNPNIDRLSGLLNDN